VLIFLAIVLLIVLPGPWNLIGFLVVLPIWILELFGWNRTVKRRRRVVGAQTLIGKEGVVITPCQPIGQVRLGGEIWAASCEAGAANGENVRVTGRTDLTLIVEPVGARSEAGLNDHSA
jgi:membrane protein implicated in regulation of membrane protease activity